MKKAIKTRLKIDEADHRETHVPIEKIVVTENERADFEGIEELADSITTRGMLQAIVVRPLPDGNYKLIAGERRYRAARLAEWQIVPVTFTREADDPELADLVDRAIENFQRKDLHPLEEAAVCVKLRGKLGSLAAVAKIVGRGERSVYQTIQLLELSEQAQAAFRENVFTASHAELIVRLPAEDQNHLAERMRGEPLSVAALDRVIKDEIKPPKLPKAEPTTPPADGQRLTANEESADVGKTPDPTSIVNPKSSIPDDPAAGAEGGEPSPAPEAPAADEQSRGPSERPADTSAPARPDALGAPGSAGSGYVGTFPPYTAFGMPGNEVRDLIADIRSFDGDAPKAYALVWKYKDRWAQSSISSPTPPTNRPAEDPAGPASEAGGEPGDGLPTPGDGSAAPDRADSETPSPPPRHDPPASEGSEAVAYAQYAVGERSFIAQYERPDLVIYDVCWILDPPLEGYSVRRLAVGREGQTREVHRSKHANAEVALDAADAWHEAEKAGEAVA